LGACLHLSWVVFVSGEGTCKTHNHQDKKAMAMMPAVVVEVKVARHWRVVV